MNKFGRPAKAAHARWWLLCLLAALAVLELSMTEALPADSSCDLVLTHTTNERSYLSCVGDRVQAVYDRLLLPADFEATGLSPAAVAAGDNSTGSSTSDPGCLITFFGDGHITVRANVQGMMAWEQPGGSVICIRGSVTVTLEASTFVSNCAQHLIYAQGNSKLLLRDTKFVNGCSGIIAQSMSAYDVCRSLDYSKALVKGIGNADLSLQGVQVTNNTGCQVIIGFENVKIHVENSNFVANYMMGGAVEVRGNAQANITGCFFDGQPSLYSAFVSDGDSSRESASGVNDVVIQDSVIQGDSAVSMEGNRVQLFNVSITAPGPLFSTVTRMLISSVKPGIYTMPCSSKNIFEMANTTVNGQDPCTIERMQVLCPLVHSCNVIVCDNSFASHLVGDALLSVHGYSLGYKDVCVDPNRVRNMSIAYSLFGVAVVIVVIGACIWKGICAKFSPLQKNSGIILHLQLLLSKPFVHRGLLLTRVLVVGADIVSDAVALAALAAAGAAAYYVVALLLPIVVCSLVLHANICKAYFPPQQRLLHIPGSLWPYKLFGQCHAAIPGVLGICSPPWAWVLLMHYPVMLLHALFPKSRHAWLQLPHYTELFSFLVAILQAPISIVLITLGSWMGVSDDLYPHRITTWIYFFTISTSMAHIVLWVAALSYAAITDSVRSKFRAMFDELIIVPESLLLNSGQDLAVVQVSKSIECQIQSSQHDSNQV